MTDALNITWRKSSRSTNNGACVEVGTWYENSRAGVDCVDPAEDVQVIAVRDSKNPGGARLMFSQHEWAVFAEMIKRSFKDSDPIRSGFYGDRKPLVGPNGPLSIATGHPCHENIPDHTFFM